MKLKAIVNDKYKDEIKEFYDGELNFQDFNSLNNKNIKSLDMIIIFYDTKNHYEYNAFSEFLRRIDFNLTVIRNNINAIVFIIEFKKDSNGKIITKDMNKFYGDFKSQRNGTNYKELMINIYNSIYDRFNNLINELLLVNKLNDRLIEMFIKFLKIDAIVGVTSLTSRLISNPDYNKAPDLYDEDQEDEEKEKQCIESTRSQMINESLDPKLRIQSRFENLGKYLCEWDSMHNNIKDVPKELDDIITFSINDIEHLFFEKDLHMENNEIIQIVMALTFALALYNFNGKPTTQIHYDKCIFFASLITGGKFDKEIYEFISITPYNYFTKKPLISKRFSDNKDFENQYYDLFYNNYFDV